MKRLLWAIPCAALCFGCADAANPPATERQDATGFSARDPATGPNEASSAAPAYAEKEDVLALLARAQTLRDEGDLESAFLAVDRALRVDPASPAAKSYCQELIAFAKGN